MLGGTWDSPGRPSLILGPLPLDQLISPSTGQIQARACAWGHGGVA